MFKSYRQKSATPPWRCWSIWKSNHQPRAYSRGG